MPAGVVYDMGMHYLYGDFWLKNNGETATTGSTADTGLQDGLQMLMSMRKPMIISQSPGSNFCTRKDHLNKLNIKSKTNRKQTNNYNMPQQKKSLGTFSNK